MTLDAGTLFAIGGLVTIMCGMFFLMETLLRRNDVVGRLWSVFYISGIFVVFAYIVAAVDPATWWAYGPANGGFALAIGMLWSGARAANGVRALVPVPLAAGVLVGLATVLPGPGGGYWAGSFEMFVAVAVFAALCAFETTRLTLGQVLSARILSVILIAFALFYAGRALGFVTLGTADPIFLTFFGTEASTLFEIALIVVGTITLSTIQAERFGRTIGREPGDGLHLDGVLGPRAFRELAESWLLRSLRERATLVLLVVEIADLDEINVAFGRAAGDHALRVTSRIVTTTAPSATLVGRLSARRFALLMPLPTNDSVEAIAARIGDAVLNTPVDDRDRFRVTTFRGITSTRTAGSRFDDLVRAATDAVAIEAAEAKARANEIDAKNAP